MDYREFSTKIKAKYPQYADLDDRDLAQKIIAKYPDAYGDVTFEPEAKSPDLASLLYHGLIEGGAMTLGGAAGATLGAGAGPVGAAAGGTALAAASYPPAKRAAEAIDRWRGIEPEPSQGVLRELGTGLATEATGAIAGKAIVPLAKKIKWSKIGEALSGTPASNLRRAFKQGFSKTYLKPKSLADAGEEFGKAKFDLIGKTITPEEQVAMTVNPRGEANQKVADVMLKWLKNEPISAEEALAARQGIDAVFPADTAKKQVQRGSLGQFREAMNEVIENFNPEFARANKEYAASKLRSQLLIPLRVNKSNPDQISKLGLMLFGSGYFNPDMAKAAIGQSPLAMGVVSATAGSLAHSSVVGPTMRRALLSQLIDKITSRNVPVSP